jgi:salicylate hydroxylase
VRSFGEVGAGIQMTPNAVRVLEALGMRDALERIAFQANAIVGLDGVTGRELYRTPLRGEIRRVYGADYLHAHRRDLHAVLLRATGDTPIRLGARCVGVRQDEHHAAVVLDDGREIEGDVVIGADGIHSSVRAALFGPESPTFTGNICWRTLIPIERIGPGIVTPDVTMWQGPRGHVVTYFVRAGALLNVVAVMESSQWVEESWNTRSSRAELAEAYRGWHPRLLELFSAAEDVYRWGLFDREPMPCWSRGRITLLGDAAHAMLPFLAQGAAMGLEDSLVLAELLARRPSAPALALAKYEALRRPRASRVQLAARERGKTYHLNSRWQKIWRDALYLVGRRLRPQSTGLATGWIYEYDAAAPAAYRQEQA